MQSGFDTHINQAGKHERLSRGFAESIVNYHDIETIGDWGSVVLVAKKPTQKIFTCKVCSS